MHFDEKIAETTPSNSDEAIRAAKKRIIDFLACCYADRYDSGIKKLLAVIDIEGGG